MSATTLAVVVSLAAIASPPGHQGSEWSRERLLPTPRPHPAQRVDSPARPENGRLWVSSSPVGSRTPAASRTLYEPGPGHYGVSARALHANVFVRLGGMQVIAISPWERLESHGLERLERARNIWLREQGLIQTVRTHVNARYLHQDEYGARARELPAPRATIRLHTPAPARDADRWAGSGARPADASRSAQVVRIVAPAPTRTLPPRVIAPRDDAIATSKR